jgi:hypothetical protein
MASSWLRIAVTSPVKIPTTSCWRALDDFIYATT